MKTFTRRPNLSRASSEITAQAKTVADNRAQTVAQRQLVAHISNTPLQTVQRRKVATIQRMAGTATLQREPTLKSKGYLAASKNASKLRNVTQDDFDTLKAKGESRRDELENAPREEVQDILHDPFVLSSQADSHPQSRLQALSTVDGMAVKTTGSADGKSGSLFKYKVISSVTREGSMIASFENVFYLDLSTEEITKVDAINNVKSNLPEEYNVNGTQVQLFMDEVLELQYNVAKRAIDTVSTSWCCRTKLASFSGTGVATGQQPTPLSFPLTITREPAPGTKLATALKYATSQHKSAADITLVAFGSEHGTTVHQICKKYKIPYSKVSVSIANEGGTMGNVSFTINK